MTASINQIREAMDLSDEHYYDAMIYSDGVLFTARRPDISLIIKDETRIDELATVNKLIDELNDEYIKRIDTIVSLILD